jgi:hypothetical protein
MKKAQNVLKLLYFYHIKKILLHDKELIEFVHKPLEESLNLADEVVN